MSNLIKELKNKMGYTVAPENRCKNCVHCEEIDGVLDRTWETYCNLNPIQTISVNKNGRCKHFEGTK